MRWQKEKDPLAPKDAPSFGRNVGFPTLCLLGLLTIGLTVASFLLFREGEGSGDISRAVSYFEDFFDENEAIAVFLGWEGR
jgi:hypothetical protein